jgi:hypothetical protein
MKQQGGQQRELIALVADDDIRATIVSILRRPESLGIRPIDVDWSDVPVHPGHDPGCLLRSHEILRAFQHEYAHALVVLDHHGCGQETEPPLILEKRIEDHLQLSGWEGRCAAVVIEPELEAWIWSDSPHVERCLGWVSRQASLRKWLEEKNLWPRRAPKPSDPETALRATLYEVRKTASAKTYQDLSACVSLVRCSDRAFMRFKTILQNWFPPNKK